MSAGAIPAVAEAEPGLLHATAVAIGDAAVLLAGASGAGKSDLALRLIDRGAVLVSDDYTRCTAAAGQLLAAPPPAIAGRMEVRGVGILAMPHVHNVPVALVVTLDDKPERMPDRSCTIEILGVAIPCLTLTAHEASTPLKIEWALRTLDARAP